MNKYGYYTKHFNGLGISGEDNSIILSFDARCDDRDNQFEATKLTNTTGSQVIEERKEMYSYEFIYNDNSRIRDIKHYYNNLLYSFYNIYGQRVKNIIVHFDFDNSTITVNNRTLRIENDTKREFVFKVLKTKIKAIDGVQGLYKHILESMHSDSVFNCVTYSALCKIGGIEKE